jgi:hypothetical protein
MIMPRHIDHAAEARAYLDNADSYANRDGMSAEARESLVTHNLRMAEVHASLAIAQSMDTVASVLEDRVLPSLETMLAR